MSNVQKIKEFWNERAIQYGANQEATLGEIAVKCLEIYEINRHLDHDKIILDVGCGNGYTAKIFAKNYKSKIFGIDYSPEMIEIANQNIILLRDSRYKLRAFANTCRHRNARIIDGKGSCKGLRCPFHSWFYNLEGELISAPCMETNPNFRKEELCFTMVSFLLNFLQQISHLKSLKSS